MQYNAVKRLGQNFLVNAEIAKAEAAHAEERNVIEMGPGYGTLTYELCKHAKRVVAIEKDTKLFMLLKTNMHSRKLVLINKDFFDCTGKELMLEGNEIMISNVPYNLSSKVIDWLIEKKMEALLCLQKEFVDHMLAIENTDKYSKLSVVSRLSFSMTRIMDVSKGNFRPIPKVDSSIIYLKPKSSTLTKEENTMINLLMQHKKKTVRNAFLDSRSYLGKPKKELSDIAEKISGKEERLFKMAPQRILERAREINSLLKKSR